jgi:hypothetical protein
MICSYGCGQEASFQLKNKNWCCSKNVASCPAIRKKISLKNKGKVKTEEWRKNISKSRKGKPAWNKNRNDYLTDQIRKRMGEKKVGKIPWNKGKTNIYSSNTIQILSKKASNRLGPNSSNWKGGYYKNNIPLYENYITDLYYAESCRRNPTDKKILDVKCTYCGKWFTPTIQQVYERIRALNGKQAGEQRLYCSVKCKSECSIYGQHKYPKDYKTIATSREVQPELRQMRFKIDKYICQKCNQHQDDLEVGLHCHHLEGIRWEPLESADLDKVITLCKTCHIETHKKEGCGYNDMKCKNKEKE